MKALYQAFYSEDKDFEDIEVENCIPDDKDGNCIFDCIDLLMRKINENLDELPLEDSEESSQQECDDLAVKSQEDNSTKVDNDIVWQ